jgi:hypothetical protein
VPILNLFRPYKMMREMFIMTGGLAGKDAPGGKRYRTGWLGWWWALCVIPVAAINFVLFAAFLYPPALGIGPEFLAEIILEICGLDNSYEPYGPSLVLMVSAIVLYLSQLVLTLMTVKLIGDYSRMEAALPGDPPENEPPAGTGLPEGPPYIYIRDDPGFDIARPPFL